MNEVDGSILPAEQGEAPPLSTAGETMRDTILRKLTYDLGKSRAGALVVDRCGQCGNASSRSLTTSRPTSTPLPPSSSRRAGSWGHGTALSLRA